MMGRILDMSEKLLAQMQDRLEDAEAKIDRLTEYIEVLVQALRTGGQPVPPMPRQMRQEAHDREASRGATHHE
jgi:ABC-type Fe3+-hydroxamate transport system substrate-binding protein